MSSLPRDDMARSRTESCDAVLEGSQRPRLSFHLPPETVLEVQDDAGEATSETLARILAFEEYLNGEDVQPSQLLQQQLLALQRTAGSNCHSKNQSEPSLRHSTQRQTDRHKR